jgi:hypothetical protein
MTITSKYYEPLCIFINVALVTGGSTNFMLQAVVGRLHWRPCYAIIRVPTNGESNIYRNERCFMVLYNLGIFSSIDGHELTVSMILHIESDRKQ